MGHTSTTAEVVEFKMGEDHKKNKTVPIVQLLGVWEGGREGGDCVCCVGDAWRLCGTVGGSVYFFVDF